jgi:hypothetical protein
MREFAVVLVDERHGGGVSPEGGHPAMLSRGALAVRSAGRAGAVRSGAVETWFDYRTVWATHPWVLAYAVVVVAVFAVAVAGTFVGGPLAILFIPSLAGAYAHHLMVMKRVDR